ncbi:hypothetical protein B0H10DRAFT_1823211, partial [Mycena sp. CBHHK59/15]
EGAVADILVKLGIVKLVQKRIDVSEEARTTNATLQRLVEKGDYLVSHTVDSTNTDEKLGYTAEEDDMVCLNLRVDFRRKPF